MIEILGAGMAGMLAANMLRKHNPIIYELKKELPDNHGALLRFRSTAVSDATCIDFKKVRVMKNIYHDGKIYNEPNILMCNSYSKRVTGEYSSRSIKSLESVDRYIAPDNFLESCSDGLDIRLGKSLSKNQLLGNKFPIISTIPMPALMAELDYGNLDYKKFKHREITSVRVKIKVDCDVYQTYYIPNSEDSHFYRVSITGDVAIFETNVHDVDKFHLVKEVGVLLRRLFGIDYHSIDYDDVKIVKQKYGKLIPIDKQYARDFISWATKNYNIYSLGRFSTWRQILMDDCVNDIKVIEKFWII